MRKSTLRAGAAACAIVIAAGIAACASNSAGNAPPPPPAPKPQLGAWGVDLTGMDKSVKPGDDFFMYVNGDWYKAAVIPPDRSSTGSFQDLEILSEKRMKDIVDGLEAKPYDQLAPEEKQLRDFYDAYTDRKQIDANGLAPAKADLDYLAHLKTRAQVAAAMGDPARETASIFAGFVNSDAKDSDVYRLYLTQSGLGMPDRDYYLKDDPALAAARDAYKKHLVDMMTLAGMKDAQKRADAVYALEVKIAQAEWPAADRRNVLKVYNPMTVPELEKYAPQFDWRAFFTAGHLPLKTPDGKDRTVIVRENTAFPALAKAFAETPVSVWRDYLTVHYLHAMAPYLPKTFDDANFDFYGKVLNGQAEQLPRDIRGVHELDDRLGHPLGKLYVAKYFPPAAKAKAEQLVSNLLKAYDADIRTISWMTPETRQKALDKLHAFTPHIGYPDKWRDYSGLVIKRDDLVGDVERSDVFEWMYRMNRIDQPVDRDEWEMTPPTINAYYTPFLNAIFFPAAILQPPFFDPNADDAVNYGGIGAVIGHEISHGFDDQGSHFDGKGELNNWWTPDDEKAFQARTSALGAQFDSYEPLPGLHVNGRLTMGENIGDLSGLAIALKAYHLSLDGKPAPMLDGYTGDQRFYLSYGQIWRSKYRDSAIRRQVLSNPHAPAEFRVDGNTRNQDAWYAAFDVKSGDKYYLPPDQRVRLW